MQPDDQACSPSVSDRAVALGWLDRLGGDTFDGIIAKQGADRPIGRQPRRHAEYKLTRTADCVVGGFRPTTPNSPLVGSLTARPL